jgi:hypothetical protein
VLGQLFNANCLEEGQCVSLKCRHCRVWLSLVLLVSPMTIVYGCCITSIRTMASVFMQASREDEVGTRLADGRGW